MRIYKNISLIITIIFLTISSKILYSQTFSKLTSDTLTGVYLGTNEWGDYDNDGDYDVIITGYSATGNISKLYKNNGNGTFSELTSLSLPNLNYPMAKWADYDNDNDLDFILLGQDTNCINQTLIYKNEGNDVFLNQNINLPSLHYSSVDWGDFDNDCDLDLIFSLSGKLYRNEGNNIFTELQQPTWDNRNTGSSEWGDYNLDGYLDFVVTGITSPSDGAKVFTNNGDNTFDTIDNSIFEDRVTSTADWGDYDNDGDLDLIVSGLPSSTSVPNTKLYKNVGNGNFVYQSSIIFEGIKRPSVSWGDYNNDGYLDLLLSGSLQFGDEYIGIYKNNGNNTFTEIIDSNIIPLKGSKVTWIDFDNDGDLDISACGKNDTNYYSNIYINNGNNYNTPPSIPTGLSSQQIGDKYLLTWNRSTDNETADASISYNIRVGSTDSTQDIKSSQTNLSGDYSMLVSLGSVKDTFAYIKVPDVCSYMGEYTYWSVQAIDNGYMRSNFSATDSISPNFKAFISNDTIITLGDSIQLYAEANIDSSSLATYNWTPNANINNQNISNPKVSPKYNTTYYLTASYGSYFYIDSVQVLVNPFKVLSNVNLPTLSTGSMKWGDYDNDGDLDIFCVGRSNGWSTSSYSNFYNNMGNANFQTVNSSVLPRYKVCTDFADYDNDGDLDLALIGYNSKVDIYKNNGSFNMFKINSSSIKGDFHSYLEWGDYDNDGDKDLLISGDDTTKIYENKSNNIFQEQSSVILPNLLEIRGKWGDYNSDGYLDILIAGYPYFTVYKNNGDKTFSDIQINDSSITYGYHDLDWVDYNNDGKLDIFLLVDAPSTLSEIMFYKNMGNDLFKKDTTFCESRVNYKEASEWVDFDNDGDLDVVFTASSYSNGLILYENKLDTLVYSKYVNLPKLFNPVIDWGDFDNDNDLDIYCSGLIEQNNYVSYILENLSEYRTSNIKPSIPQNISFKTIGNEVNINWDKSTDDYTPSQSISYNIAIGTQNTHPNSIVSSHSLINGYRMLSERGNCDLDTFAKVKFDSANFNQIFQARIQSIDNTNLGSYFSQAVNIAFPPDGYPTTSKDTICLGESVGLGVNVINGDPSLLTYTWSSNEYISDSTIINPVAKPTNTAWYKVKATSGSGLSFIDSIKIVVRDLNLEFIADDTTFYSIPFTVNFTNYTPNNYLYNFKWYFGDASIVYDDTFFVSHTYNQSGIYTVALVAEQINTGCKDSISKVDFINCSVSGISKSSSNMNLEVFPNPSKNVVNIVLNNDNIAIKIINIYNVLGDIIISKEVNDSSLSIDISALTPGVYLLEVINSKGDSEIRKVEKK